MKRLKNLVLSMLFVLVVCGGVLFVGCDSGNDNMTLSLSSTNVEIVLGETQNNTMSIMATVTNAKDYEVSVDYDSPDINVSVNYLGDGVSEIKVVAFRKCSNVDVVVKGAKKSAYFTVSAVVPISSISPKQNSYYLAYDKNIGGEFVLSESLFNILPNGVDGTNQTKLNYSLQSDINGVYIQNNVLKIEPNLNDLPSAIVVEVVSAYKDTVRTEITVDVISAIDTTSIEILDSAGANAEIEYNIPRNSESSNTLSLVVRVPFALTDKQLSVKPVFEYGDIGIVVNDSIIEKNDILGCYDYTFNFSVDGSVSKQSESTDFLWFEIAYSEYPDVKSYTNNRKIKITTYDEITDISCTVDGTSVDLSKQLNIYTSYYVVNQGGIDGLAIKFDAIPTTATTDKLSLNVDILNTNLKYLIVKDQNGSEITFDAQGKYLFDSGTTLYFMARTGFNLNQGISLTVISEENTEIQKTLNFVFKDGITKLGFVYNNERIDESRTYYLENDLTSEFSSAFVTFAVAPSTIDLTTAKVTVGGDVFEIVGQIEKVGTLGDATRYEMEIRAIQGKSGEGSITIKFESGQQITCKVVVFEKLDDVQIQTSPEFNTSSAVGDIKYTNNSLSYVAVKNGQSLPLVYNTNATINTISYLFSDYIYDSEVDDVYDENSAYNVFENSSEDKIYSSLSNVISSNYLRAMQYISPITVGKVWVKVTFTGKMLQLNQSGLEYEYVDSVIEKYILVEIYNPIVSLTVSDKNVEVYAYDEVGESNKNLSVQTITVELNRGGLVPTYNKLTFNDYELVNNVLQFKPTNSDIVFFTITYIGNNQYRINAITRNDNGDSTIGDDEFSETSINISAKDISNINGSWDYSIKVSMLIPELVEQITVNNVPNGGIYLKTRDLSTSISDYTFRILTSVLPNDALNKELSYRFIPDSNTNADIISIDENGTITVNGEFGGNGVIRIIPKDCILIDEFGNEYFRDNAESVILDINIKVADGASKETALYINDLSEIQNSDLHYILIKDCTYNSNSVLFETFNGGLYGKRPDYNDIATITLNGFNLFNILGENAVIEDINICGTVNANSMLAEVNNGTINNVNVDLFGTNVSKVISTGESAGGIVNVNNGVITNCSFAGTISATNLVGGIAGINTGRISSCRVLIYNMGEYEEMNFTANRVGGIVGEMKGYATLGTSYIYNYSNNNNMYNNTNIGGIVGIISSNDIKIEQCFAYCGMSSNFYAEKTATKEDKNLIKDSYILYLDKDSEENAIVFSYFMTTTYGTSIVGTAKTSSQVYSGVSFGSKEIWNNDTTTNYGYPYLNNVKFDEALTSSELSEIKIQNSRLSLEEVTDGNVNAGIIYIYNPYNTVLTESEENALVSANTIDFYELFGITKIGGILVTSSDENIIAPSVDSLYIKNTGVCELTIMSKYDLSVAPKTIVVCVLNYTSNFRLEFNDYDLGASSQIKIRNGKNANVISKLQNSIVLVDRQIPLVQNDYKVLFNEVIDNVVQSTQSSYVIGNKVGVHTISATFDDELQLQISLSFDFSNYEISGDTKQLLQKSLTANTTRKLSISKTYGPISIQTSVNNAEISPSDDLVVTISLETDAQNDDVSAVVYDGDGNKIDSIFDVDIIKLSSTNSTINYKSTISVKDEFKGIDFNENGYIVRFVSSDESIYSDIKIKILAQEVIRIDINNYVQIDYNETIGSAYSYYPNNVLSPGTSGLLDIMVYPGYVNYTHITVTSQPVNSNKITLISMAKNTGNSYVMNSTTNFEFVENGVKVYALNNSDDIARFYVRVVVPSSVSIDSVYDINVNVYNGDEIIYTEIYSLIIAPQEKAGISVNGKDVIFAVMGDTIVADVIYDQTQTLENIYTAPVEDGSVNSVVMSDNNFTPYGTKYLKGTATISVSPVDSAFYVYVETSRVLNGVKETVYSSMLVYVIDFELDFSKTTLANNEGSNEIVGNKYFYEKLDFNIGVNVTKDGQNQFNNFINNWYFSNNYNHYTVNEIAKDSNSLMENLYYVNGNQETPVVIKNQDGTYTLTENDIIKSFDFSNGISFIGKNIGSQEMLLQIQANMPDGTTLTYKYYFTIRIENYTDEESPEQITNAQEFLSAFENEEENDYILMSDIILYDYTPLKDTSKIRSLDGNGHQIVIMGFNYDETQATANFALFEAVSENTTLKNLRINIYHVGELNISSSATRTLNVAPVAINNYGIITNTDVVSYRYRANDIVPKISGINITTDSTVNISAKTAGFVLNNYGVITNSRVGGTSVDVYSVDVNNGIATAVKNTTNLDAFVISSFGEITGFVHTNSGHISSSFASNLRIVNNSNIDYTTITTGFAISNSGTITTSYAKGVKSNVSDVHATRYGIETSGISAGFIYSNSGEIRDSYSNITLTNTSNNPGRSSAGFVYINNENANIYTSLSLSRIIGSTTTQMNFAGVDERGNYQNYGNIENSYYYDELANEDSSIIVEEAYGEGAKLVNSITAESYYYGFNFASSDAEDGIWQITTTGPELISPNDIAVSLRYESAYSESQNGMAVLNYVDGFEYGSKNNPIIIRDAKEFDEVLGGTKGSARNYVNKEKGQIFGSYRLVNDINLQELLTEENETRIYRLASSSMSLTGIYKDAGNKSGIGKFDGNGFTINGLALSDNGVDSSVEGFGIFSKITDGAIVMNVDIVLGATNAEGEIFGIEAKNIKYVGALAGTVSDSTVVGVNLTSAYENTNSVTVRGKNIVGGIIGRVVGNSYVSNLSTKDISVTAVMYPESYNNIAGSSYTSYNAYSRTNDSLNSYVSYAGGIIGVIDCYTETSINNYNFANAEVSSNANATMLKTKGTMQITGGTVGGVFGYVGPLTIVQDALFELAMVEDYTTQGILSYNGFAGGIVGYNMGYLRQVRSESEEQLQDQIEDSIDEYYKGDYSVDRGNEQLFIADNYAPIAIGGLVGLNKSGKIEKSYSKLNVVNQKAEYAGGAIGFVEQKGTSNSLTVEEVYASGDVRAKVAGGFIGQSIDDCSLTKVNAVNYWGVWLADENNESEVYSLLKSDNFSFDKVAALSKEDIVFANNEVIYNYNDNDNLEKVTSFSKITGIGDDGELFDSIFKGNEWDSNSWQRDDDELFPHILFGYHNNVIYIRNQSDIELMRTSGGDVTFVIDPEDDGNNIITRDSAYIVIDKRISPIVGFSNTLKGKDGEKTYGFIFAVNQNRALFETTNGAYFSNFEVKYEKNISLNSSLSKNSAFVRTANNTEFRNLKFSDINANVTEGNNIIGVVCAEATGLTIFDNIKILKSNINVTSSIQNNIEAGLVFGKASLSTDTYISNISVLSSNINVNANIGLNNMSNIGLIGGSIIGTSNKDQNRTVFNLTNVTSDNNTKVPIDGNVNIISNSTNVVTIKNANVGYLFGNINNVNVQTAIDAQIQSNVSVNGKIQLNQVNIGGFAGNIENSDLTNVCILPNIKIQSTNVNAGVSVGGLVGTINTSSIENCTVGDSDSVFVVENVNGSYVGSLAGYAGTLEGENGDIFKVKSYLNITVKTKDEKSNGDSVYVGGLVGYLSNYNISNSIYYNSIQLFNEANSSVYLAGLCGGINSSNITNSAFTGEVKNVVKVTNEKWSTPTDVSVFLYTSGFIGITSGECDVNNNVVAGNVYPTYAYNSDNGEFDKSVTTDITLMDSYVYGGICAQVDSTGTNSLNIANNICLNTHYNKLDEDLSSNYQANAIVGSYSKENVKDDNDGVVSSNKYSHIYTLCTQSNNDFGENTTLYDLLIEARNVLTNRIVNEDNEKDSFVLWSDDLFTEGTKLNPMLLSLNPSEEIIDGQYIYLQNSSILTKIGILKNSVLVADGAVISFEYNGEQTSPIGAVDKNSYVAGVVSYVNYTNAQDSAGDKQVNVDNTAITLNNDVAGFVQYNSGIIYSCNVRGRSNTENKVINGIIKSSLPVSGFVSENAGLIKESYVASSMISHFKGNKDEVSIAGFVRKNSGAVLSCYASGSLQNSEENSTEYIGLVYAFGPGDVKYCYTICKIINLKSKGATYYVFDNNSSNYYDKIALESNVEIGGESEKTTDEMAVNYKNENLTSIYKGNMSLNVNYAYGYGSFSDGVYASIDYMHHNTGDGTSNNPYQIPNLGKLNQIANGSEEISIYYVLVQDIGSNTKTLDWKSKNVENIVLNGFDGVSSGSHTIKNLLSENGGIFNEIKNSTIKNIVIDSLIIYYYGNNDKVYLGSLGNNAVNSTITGINAFIDENDAFDIENVSEICYGAIIGLLQTNSILTNCSISNTSDNNNTFKIYIGYVSNWIIGGLVGCLDGGTVTNSALNKNISLEFLSDIIPIGNTIIFGGIVGQQLSGTISYSSINSKIDVFTSDLSKNGEDLVLYAGGIVGYVGVNSALEMNDISEYQDATTLIDNCYLTEYANLVVGNQISFITTYAGGISGYGGNITNCYNKAMSITSYAKYQFEPVGDGFDQQQGMNHLPNVYVNGNEEGYSKLFLRQSKQQAYSAGIANQYQSVNSCINYSQVTGGINARSPYAYLEVDGTELNNRLQISMAVVATVVASLAPLLISGTVFPIISVFATSIMASGLAMAFVSIKILSRSIEIPEYYFENTNYKDVYEQYFNDCQVWGTIDAPKNIAEVFSRLIEVITGGKKIGYILEGNSEGKDHQIAGTPNYVDKQKSLLTMFTGNSWMGLNKTDDGKYIYSQESSKLLYVDDIYFDSIGLGREGATKVNAYSVYSGNEDTISSVYEIEINGSSQYGIMDNSVATTIKDGEEVISNVFKTYGLVYNTGFGSFDYKNYTKAVTSDDIEKEDLGDNWSQYNGEWILTTSEEIAKTSLDSMLNSNISFDDDDNAIINIGSQNGEGYSAQKDFRTMTSLINDLVPIIPTDENGLIVDKDSLINNSAIREYIQSYGIEVNAINTEKFHKLCNSLIKGGYTVKVLNDISFNSAITPIGTVSSPFNGSFVGTTSHTDQTTQLSNIKLSYSNTSDETSLGLFGYVKSFTMENITLSYSSDFAIYTTNNINVGGVVGTVVENGKINITDEVALYFYYKDYKVDNFGNRTISKAVSNIGGVIANVSNNCSVNINNLTIEKINIELIASSTSVSNENNAIGGIIGKVANSDVTLTNVEIARDSFETSDFAITTTNSLNSVVGGVIGYVDQTDLILSNVNVNNGIIDVESNNLIIKTGGVVGHLNQGDKKISLNEVNVGLSLISAKTSNPQSATYSAGLFAFAQTFNEENVSMTNVTIQSNVSGQKVYILSGIGGSVYPNSAYASSCVANNVDANAFLIENCETNTKPLSIANPNYESSISTENQLNNNYNELLTSSKQIVYTEGYGKYKDNNGNIKTDYTDILKIDLYEFKAQINKNIENSYVDGKLSTMYNFQKEYLLFVIKETISTQEDETYLYNYEERVYKIIITGTIDNNDYNLVNDVKMEYVTGFKYSSSDLIYNLYKYQAYPLANRTSNFYPLGINASTVTPLTESDLYIDSNGSQRIDLNMIISQTDSTDVQISSNGGSISVNSQDKIDTFEYKNITSDNSNGYSLTVNCIKNDISTSIDIITFNGLTDNNGWKLTNNNNIKSLNLDNLENKTIENVYVVYGENKIQLTSYETSEKIEVNLKTIEGNEINVLDAVYKPYIISCETNEEGLYNYTDYIFVTSNSKTLYLGKIYYLSSEQISPNSSRNNFFFPISETIIEFSNDLLPLNEISETNEFSEEIKVDLTTINYEINSSGEINKKQELTTQTYTITLESITSNRFIFDISYESEVQTNEEVVNEITLSYNNSAKANVVNNAVVEGLSGNYIVVSNRLNYSYETSLFSEVFEAYVFTSDGKILQYILEKTSTTEDTFRLVDVQTLTFGPDGNKASVQYADNDNYTYLTFTYGNNDMPFVLEGTYSISVQGNSLRIENSKNNSVYFVVDILNGKLVISEMQYTITLGENTYTIIENIPTNSITIKNETQTVTIKNLFENVDEIGMSFNRYAKFELKQELDIGETYISISTSDNEKELVGIYTDLTMIRVLELFNENNSVYLYQYNAIGNNEEFDMLDENKAVIDASSSKFSLFVEENGALTKSDVDLFNSLLITTGTTIASINRELVDSVVDCVVIKLIGNTTIRFDIDSGFVYNMGTTFITVKDVYDATIEKTFIKYNYTQMVSSNGGYDYLFKFKIDETGKFITIKYSSSNNGCEASVVELLPFNNSYAVKVNINVDNKTMYFTLDGYEIVGSLNVKKLDDYTEYSLGGVVVNGYLLYNDATIKAETDIVVREYIFVRKEVQASATTEPLTITVETSDVVNDTTIYTQTTLTREIAVVNGIITIKDTIIQKFSTTEGVYNDENKILTTRITSVDGVLVQYIPSQNDTFTQNQNYQYSDNEQVCYIISEYDVNGTRIDLTFGVN